MDREMLRSAAYALILSAVGGVVWLVTLGSGGTLNELGGLAMFLGFLAALGFLAGALMRRSG